MRPQVIARPKSACAWPGRSGQSREPSSIDGISGIQALGQLGADPTTRAIPVIAVTASVMVQDRQKVMAAGFNGFQGKPISVRELLETIRGILERPGS
jgi:CheY-like chemotaxis protein